MSHLSSASLSVPRSVVDHSKPGLPDVPVWLDEIEGDRALSWVKKQNFATCTAYEGTERFERLRSRLEAVCDSPGRVPTVSEVVGGLYNVWTDDEHSHGLWRRTTWDSYRASAPVTDSAACDDVTEWEILLDVDALREEEECAWVWRGASLLRTGPMAGRRALVDLSVNGSDADVTREYDIDEQRFVDVTEGGFSRSLAKGSLLWADDVGERVLALTDWGPGSLTASGYPRQVRRLSRGEYAGGINPASGPGEMLLVAPTDAVAAWAHRDRWGRTWLMVRLDFYNEELWLLPDGAETLPVSAAAVAGDGFFIAPGAIHIDVPVSAKVSAVRGHLLIQLREDWAVGTMTYPAGALLATPLEDFLSGSPEMTILFSPTPERSLQGWVTTAHHVVLHLLDDVVDAFEVATDPTDNTDNNEWRVRPLDLAPLATAIGSAITLTTPDSADAATLLRPGRPLLSVSLRSVSAVEDDRLWITVSSFTVPTTLAVASLGADGALDFVEVLRRAPELFDASDIVVSQHAAISADGTRVPYFQIGRSTSSDEYARTMLYGYGGFEVPVGIGYLSTTGSAWLEEGGTYVIANVRGGGEYGPAWHQAGLKENRHHVHEDFAAVARSLVDRGVTTPSGIVVDGDSNGGLLAGAMLTRYPELVGAVVCEVPLLDMGRYTHLMAGASWKAEYGDPDVAEEWEWIRGFSPFHLLRQDTVYPPVLFITSTRDDRVHPAHARTMAYRMLSMGQDVTYFENGEGGHSQASTSAQHAWMNALIYTFAWERLHF